MGNPLWLPWYIIICELPLLLAAINQVVAILALRISNLPTLII